MLCAPPACSGASVAFLANPSADTPEGEAIIAETNALQNHPAQAAAYTVDNYLALNPLPETLSWSWNAGLVSGKAHVLQ